MSSQGIGQAAPAAICGGTCAAAVLLAMLITPIVLSTLAMKGQIAHNVAHKWMLITASMALTPIALSLLCAPCAIYATVKGG